MHRRAWLATGWPQFHGAAELNTTERLTHTHTQSRGPTQDLRERESGYSCFERATQVILI